MLSYLKIVFACLMMVGYLTTASSEPSKCKKALINVVPRTCCSLPSLPKELTEKCLAVATKQSANDLTPPPVVDDAAAAAVAANMPVGNHRHHPHHGDMQIAFCFTECVLNETGIYNANREIDRDAVTKFVDMIAKDQPEWKPILSEQFDICYERHEQMQQKFQSKVAKKTGKSAMPPMHHMPGMQCHPQALFLSSCTLNLSVKNCPANMWNSTAECNDLRDAFEECLPHLMMNQKS